jgi:hypothetical protein
MKRAPYRWTREFYRILSGEISAITRYSDRLVQFHPVASDGGDLLQACDAPLKLNLPEGEPLPDFSGELGRRTAVLLNGNLNSTFDIQQLLQDLRPCLARSSRLVVVSYNPYLRGFFKLLGRLGLSRAGEMKTFVTEIVLRQLAGISGYEVVRIRPCCYLPFRCLGLGRLLNRLLPVAPLLRWLSLAHVVVLRPVKPSGNKPSLTIVIPARNEAGNIRNAIAWTPQMDGVDTEIIFVEGNSTDNTWDVIQDVVAEGHPSFKLSAWKQPGKGKNDAVRFGFGKATGDLLTILDADLTMPPEMLPRFYEAYVRGHGDFINGSRLLYPMEGEAMRFLNHLGNLFFAKTLSRILGMPMGDTLCGTKLLARHDYARITRWREDFGDFDPFGDFELLFPAAQLALGSVDIPVRYKARTYGSTNINRFRHGLVLLKMTWVGFFRIYLGAGS